MRGVEIKHEVDQFFHMAVFSAVPILKVREKYTLDGNVCFNKRRDLRSGASVR